MEFTVNGKPGVRQSWAVVYLSILGTMKIDYPPAGLQKIYDAQLRQ
jgi:hypothetical protein